MKFGPVAPREAIGAIAAHSVRLPDGIIRKGASVSAEDAARAEAAGIAHIVIARLEAGDLDENTAAARLAQAVAGKGLTCEAAFTGRVNIHARANGVLRIDVAAVDRFNSVEEAITLATLPANRAVSVGEMIATVKIIPYGLAEASVGRAEAALGGEMPLTVAPFLPKRVSVISTRLPGLKESVIDKTLAVLAERLRPGAANIVADARIAHDVQELAKLIAMRAARDDEIIIIFGASAITDRRDVIPAALVQAGGHVTHLGMPVDPGNLLMIGEIAGKPVIGAPGCARSPKENGFDWVLQRLLTELPVSSRDIQAMGVGGLLMEIITRPQPRNVKAMAPDHKAPIAALVLAAGRSSRMGEANKLTLELRGKPLVRHVAEAALASQASPVLVVSGHEASKVEAALDGLDVRFIHNPDYASGMASSVKAGLVALPDEAQGAVVLLGDMPNVTPAIIDRLIGAWTPDVTAVVPTLLGQRGNPVLLGRGLFADMMTLSGDQGARRLLDAASETAPDSVVELALDDPAIALDIDTPEALKAARG
ncbi:MAG: NTP transferase domain-containing protein [Bosea sp. (in: a-proteobacteria)]